MDAKEFKKVLAQCLLGYGFTKEGGSYYKRSDDIVCAIGLQKSKFEDAYYVNVGYVIRELHPDLTPPREVDGDIRTRFIFPTDGKHVDMLDPSMLSSEEDLKTAVRENFAELIEGCISAPGLKSLLARRPTMLHQTTLRAKKALGFEAN